MEVLILSCGTGGGHNAAGHAVEEELKKRGHHVTFFNPYDLRSKALSELIDHLYIRLVQRHPKLFGCVYQIGNLVRKIPGKSPVYYANARMADRLEDYLKEHPTDYIVMPHLYPAEMVTYLYRHQCQMLHTLFIGTDYTCIPFTEETECEQYVIPSPDLRRIYEKRGIPAGKIYPLGIPVSAACAERMTKAEARARLRLDPKKSYILLAGGSMGTGAVKDALRKLAAHYALRKDVELIVICGSNQKMCKKIRKKYAPAPGRAQVQTLSYTKKMPLYLKACDLILTKPGGLTSTEAAVSEIPIVHIQAIPGCETKNVRFFCKRGMSLSAEEQTDLGAVCDRLLGDEGEQMRKRQRRYINKHAAADICDLMEETVLKK